MAEQPSNPNPEEYELVPHDQLDYLRHEVEKIKRNPFGDTRSSKDLLSSMDALNANIAKLIAILETANDDIVRDYKDASSAERLGKVLEQNEKLAKGIVAIADLLKELKELRAPAAGEAPHPAPGPARQPGTWQSATPEEQSPQQSSTNPFLEQGGVPGRPGPAKQETGRGLPPIDAGDIPPPPR